jgi:hypothetical protein
MFLPLPEGAARWRYDKYEHTFDCGVEELDADTMEPVGKGPAAYIARRGKVRRGEIGASDYAALPRND